jgi:hypothetical protein
MFLAHLEFRLIKFRKKSWFITLFNTKETLHIILSDLFFTVYASQLYIAITRRRMQENVTVWVTEQQKLSVTIIVSWYISYIYKKTIIE